MTGKITLLSDLLNTFIEEDIRNQRKGGARPNMSRLDMMTLHDSFPYLEEYNKK